MVDEGLGDLNQPSISQQFYPAGHQGQKHDSCYQLIPVSERVPHKNEPIDPGD